VLRFLSTSLAMAVATCGLACTNNATTPTPAQLFRRMLLCDLMQGGTGRLPMSRAVLFRDEHSARCDRAVDVSTSDSSIATADSVGFVTVHRDGTVAIRVSYHGLEGFATVQLVVEACAATIAPFQVLSLTRRTEPRSSE